MASATSTDSKPEKSYLSAAVDSLSPWGSSRSSTPVPKATSESSPGRNAPQPQGADHSVSHRHGLSTRRYPKDCPPLRIRWFYAVDVPKRKPGLLKEAKETKPLPAPKKFVTFSKHDSKAIEVGYQRLVEEEEDDATNQDDSTNVLGDTTGKDKLNTSLNEAGNKEDGGGRVKVPVNEDFLFDVDIERRELAPAYWLGPIYEVRRGAWFYQEGSVLRPCEEKLSLQLEEGYLKVKPFRYPKPERSEQTESRPASMAFSEPVPPEQSRLLREITPKASVENLRAAPAQGAIEPSSPSKKAVPPPPSLAHQPQTYRLFGMYMNSTVTYQDRTVAWLSSDGIMSRVSSTMYQRFAGGAYLSGVKIIRGWVEAGKADAKLSEKAALRVPATPEKSAHPGLQLDERQQKLLKRRSAPPDGGLSAPKIDVEEAHKDPETKDIKNTSAVFQNNLSDLASDTPNPEAAEEAIRQQDEQQIQDDYDGDDQSREIEHLILVTHGIGQRIGLRTASVNFVHDVNVLRQTLKSVYGNSSDLQALNSEIDKLPKNCRVQVLPICWRHLLDFPRAGRERSKKEHDIGDAYGEDDEYPALEDITLEGVPFIRSLITDLALDILLYQSAYREQISSIVLKECNRVYNLFLERNPDFTGKVSLIGHSLGSAILFDILCRQREDIHKNESSHHRRLHRHGNTSSMHDHKNLNLDFRVEDFYCLGSPIGLFQMLKGRTIAARHDPNALPAESPMDPDYIEDPFLAAVNPSYGAGERISPTTGLPYTISSPKCASLYNVFNPADPVAYRLEPLIAPAMSALKPQALPYTKGGLFGAAGGQGFSGIGSRVTQSVSGLWSSFSSGLASSLLTRGLGFSGDDVASMNTVPQAKSSASVGAGTNISSGDVTSESSAANNHPHLERHDTIQKMDQIAKDTAAHDRDGASGNAPTLIDDEIETLFAGFQKRRKSRHESAESDMSNAKWAEAEAKAKKLRREELKVRGLNQNGRVDFSIQESLLDYNPVNTIASHLSYWGDLDVSHFMMSQLLSRHRSSKRKNGAGDSLGSKDRL